MIGRDTSILLRLWLNDDPAQNSASTRYLQNMLARQSRCW
jgi:predicted nucleic-acid-binding protein